MSSSIDRRDALAAAAGLALAPFLGRSRAHAVAAPIQDAVASKPFRLIHMTDIHVQPERQAERGAAQAWARAQELKPDLVITGGEMHTDCAELHELMRASGKVRLCLSGHIHLRDRCETDGITYINDGAVSGSWWKGALEGVPEGFGVLDLRPDGSFDHRYETYGWTAKE